MKKPLTEYQQELVKNYYKNLDTISLDKLSEIVSDLFLAETESKQNRLWKRAHQAMLNLKVPPAIIEHILNKKDVKILAKNLNDWLAQKK
jgi:hypothetical protein